jgi:hypothetical protein
VNSAYGTDKKFMSAVQEILTAPPDREPLQPDTRERIRDTLAHLNHVYGGLKGGEHLRACWMKVKTPDEPEEVSELIPTTTSYRQTADVSSPLAGIPAGHHPPSVLRSRPSIECRSNASRPKTIAEEPSGPASPYAPSIILQRSHPGRG